jgi:hypothetical protein
MKLKFDKRSCLSCLIFVGIFLGLVFFVIFPLTKEIRESSQQLLLEEEARQVFSEEKENLQNFEKVYQEIEHDLEMMDDLFVNAKVPIEFINFLEEVALNSGVSIEISSVASEGAKGSLWPSLIFQLQASASFSGLSRFIERLENSIYLIEIRDLHIKKLGEGNVGASFSLKVFTK